MSKHIFLLSLIVLSFSTALSQEGPIQIIEERVANRLMFHALNEIDTIYDFKITIEGTNFRQSKAKPRLMRIPATSKVKNVARIMLLKGKEPDYTIKLEINDSLSRRALRKQFIKVKIKPEKPITVYVTENCTKCDSIIKPLEDSKWVYTRYNLAEKEEMKKQLLLAMPKMDTLQNPIFSVGGLIFPKVTNYEQLIEEMNKELEEPKEK